MLLGDDNLALSDEMGFTDGVSGSAFSGVTDVHIIMAFIIPLAVVFPSLFPLVFLTLVEAVSGVAEGGSDDSSETGGLEGTGSGQHTVVGSTG